MDKTRVAAILNEIGTLLELQGENPFRANAYHNAARAIEQLEGSLEELVAQKRLGEIKGIGESMQEKITALVTTGRLPFYEELRARFPPGLLDLLRIPGLGPKKAKVLFEQLAIDSLEKLRQACQSGKVAELKGFGLKTQQKILEGLEFLDRTGKRYLLSEAQEMAERVLRQLRDLPGVKRGEICGSVRRRKETIGDLDILVSSDDPEPVMEAFVRLPEVAQVAARGPTKSSVVLENGIGCDLRVVSDRQFPFALHYFTGSKEHNIAMRARAQSYGLKLNEYELAGPRRSIPCKEESDIFAALDMDYIPPELRENTGEIEAAANHCLPQLLETKDLRGTFHVHTDWSDGAASLEEMALAAKKLGLKYLGIADHSQSLTVANGLSPQRVRQQLAEIDALNRRLTGIRLLKGTECDILPDGSLDYDDALLSRFDYVIASVHSHFHQSPEEMTQRLIRALSHPKVLMLGHPTGRLLLRREGYKVDLDQVLKAAAQHDKMIEINANPYRLDLDWIHCKHAKALGVKLVINPDAHAPAELRFLQYGVDVARRGWLSPSDVFNTLPLSQVLRRLHRPAQR
jgi:DNA polymerase (family 10)